jgi:hypothetical protein
MTLGSVEIVRLDATGAGVDADAGADSATGAGGVVSTAAGDSPREAQPAAIAQNVIRANAAAWRRRSSLVSIVILSRIEL